MKNYLQKIFLIIALLLAAPQYSLAEDLHANDCPTVQALIAAGLTNADHDPKYPTAWTAVNYSDHFGTQYNWLLEVEFISAQTEAEAVAKGNAALKTLIFSSVDMFYCIYNGEYDGNEITARTLKINRIDKINYNKTRYHYG